MSTPYAGCNMYRGNNDKLPSAHSSDPSEHSSNPTHVRGRATLHEAYCVSFLRSYLIRDEPSTRPALKIYPQLIYKSVIFLTALGCTSYKISLVTEGFHSNIAHCLA